MPQHTFSRDHTAHSVAQDKVVSASFIVIPHAHSHPVSLMSLLIVPFVPFPSLLSSPSASPSRSTTTVQTCTRSRWLPSRAPASHWRESGRLTSSAPNTRSDEDTKDAEDLVASTTATHTCPSHTRAHVHAHARANADKHQIARSNSLHLGTSTHSQLYLCVLIVLHFCNDSCTPHAAAGRVQSDICAYTSCRHLLKDPLFPVTFPF